MLSAYNAQPRVEWFIMSLTPSNSIKLTSLS